MDDFELAKNGDSEAFKVIIETVKTKLYKTGMAILKNDDDTCDAIQETLISAYKNLNSLKNQKYFSTWIIRILINKCYDIIEKNRKVVAINQKMEIENTGYYQFYASESILENVLNNIDSDLRTVTVLYYYDELSVSEIAETLNIPEGTVKSRLSRARNTIFEILKQKEGEL